MAYLFKKQKLTRHQSGYRLFHSTETWSLHVTGHLFKAVGEKKITAMILIDLIKAFDTSESSTTWPKDIRQPVQAARFIRHYLSLWSSPMIDSRSLIVHTWHQWIAEYRLKLWNWILHGRYDTKLFLSFKSFDTDLELASVSQDLHRVVEWLCEHQLIIKPDKTKFILFGTKQQLGQLLNPTDVDSWQDL